MSVGQPQFSLNGTHRSQGYVGQTMLSRSLPRTLMKGNTIRGHGGCCGFYPIQPIVQSAVTSLNDTQVVKPSVVGTEGLIATKYRWIGRPQPYTVVKPDNNNNLNTQQDHIMAVQKKAIQDASGCKVVKSYTIGTNSEGCQVKCHYVLPEKEIAARPYSEYYLELNKACTGNDVVIASSKSTRNTPFGCG